MIHSLLVVQAVLPALHHSFEPPAEALAGWPDGPGGVSVTSFAPSPSPGSSWEARFDEVFKDGVFVEREDGEIAFEFDGRIHVDAAAFEEDVTPFEDDLRLRRLRGRLNGTFYDDWRLRLDYDFGGTIEGWRSAFVRYQGFESSRITAGNQLAPASLEELTSSNHLTFVERSLANALSPGFYNGIAVDTYGDGWTGAVGLFGNPLEENPRKRSEGEGIVARATASPVRDRDQVLHMGLWSELRSLEDESRLRLRARPEVGITSSRLVDTRTIDDAQSTVSGGLELAWMRGPFVLQGEVLGTRVNRATLPDVSFQGGYLGASCFLGDHKKRYSRRRGSFRGPRLKGDEHAWEIAARVSGLDLDDEDVDGGQGRNLTLGVNCYLSPNVTAMLNYVHARARPNRNGVDETMDAVVLRLVLFN